MLFGRSLVVTGNTSTSYYYTLVMPAKIAVCMVCPVFYCNATVCKPVLKNPLFGPVIMLAQKLDIRYIYVHLCPLTDLGI